MIDKTRAQGRWWLEPPRIAHLSYDPDSRQALCGAEILGIRTFGDYEEERCTLCLALREAVLRVRAEPGNA